MQPEFRLLFTADIAPSRLRVCGDMQLGSVLAQALRNNAQAVIRIVCFMWVSELLFQRAAISLLNAAWWRASYDCEALFVAE